MHVRRPLGAALAASLLLAVAGCSGDGAEDQGSATSGPGGAGAEEGALPEGWSTFEAEGFSVGLPPDWEERPEDMRESRAAMDVGIPFTGQPYPPPRMLAFVETEAVGPPDVRDQILRQQLEWGLGEDAEFGETTPVTVEGADAALEFEVTYTTEEATSVLDTPLEATEMRQRELIVETEGLPKLGFRFSAPADQFDEEQWETVRASIEVRIDELKQQGGGEGDA